MSNLSKDLLIDIKELNIENNVEKTVVEIEAPVGKALSLDQGKSQIIDSMQRYASEGGGNIKIKVHDMKNTLKTSEFERIVSISEMDLEGSAEQIRLLLPSLNITEGEK